MPELRTFPPLAGRDWPLARSARWGRIPLRAAKPRSYRRLSFQPRDEFAGERLVGKRAAGAGIVEGDGFCLHRRLGQLDVLGDEGVEKVKAFQALVLAE